MSSLLDAKKNVVAENPNSAMSLKFFVSDKSIVEKLLTVTDLTKSEKNNEDHIIYKIFKNIETALALHEFENISIIRKDPVVSVSDNFDNLLFPPGNSGRSSTYTRYIDDNHVLRTHTSAVIPSLFREISIKDIQSKNTFIIPGLVYRRDVIDPRHLDVFHQIDIWTLEEKTEFQKIDRDYLLKLVSVVFESACPDAEMIYYEAKHPYTINGIEVYAKIDNQEIEVLECGIINPEVLRLAGINSEKYSGLALGMGLERLIMARKELPDIRLIRSQDPRILKQMNNLDKFVVVSDKPAIVRDLSYATYSNDTEEDICEEIRNAFGDNSYLLEEVTIIQRFSHKNLHPKAQEKLGTNEDFDNVLARITLRHPDVTLTNDLANKLYKEAYPKIHKGLSAGYPI